MDMSLFADIFSLSFCERLHEASHSNAAAHPGGSGPPAALLSLLLTPLLPHRHVQVGGISLQELNALELETLWLLDYRLLVSPELTRRYIHLYLYFGGVSLTSLTETMDLGHVQSNLLIWYLPI